MNTQNSVPSQPNAPENSKGQKLSTINVEWWFHWDGSVVEKEKKARSLFLVAKSVMVKEFQNATPGCLVLEYEDLAQAHFHVIVFFERYPVGSSKETPDTFIDSVIKSGGPKPDRVNPYGRPATTMEKWLQHIRQSTLNVPPGCGGYRIEDTFISK
jgi:hypothetical protein